MLLMAIREKLLRPQQFLKIPELIDIFLDEVVTDLSKAQLLSLACIASKLESDDITIYNPPALTPAYTTRGSYILLLDEEDVRAKVADFMNGTQPDSQP